MVSWLSDEQPYKGLIQTYVNRDCIHTRIVFNRRLLVTKKL